MRSPKEENEDDNEVFSEFCLQLNQIACTYSAFTVTFSISLHFLCIGHGNFLFTHYRYITSMAQMWLLWEAFQQRLLPECYMFFEVDPPWSCIWIMLFLATTWEQLFLCEHTEIILKHFRSVRSVCSVYMYVQYAYITVEPECLLTSVVYILVLYPLNH